MQYVTTVTDTEHILKPLPEFVTEVMLENTKLREHDAKAIRKGDELRTLLKLEPTAKFVEVLRTIKRMQDNVELQKRALKDCADREHNDGKTIDRMQASLEERDNEKLIYESKLFAKEAVKVDQQRRLDNQKEAIDAYQQKIRDADANLEILHNANDSLNKELEKTRALLFEANARLVFPAIKIETVRIDDPQVQELINRKNKELQEVIDARYNLFVANEQAERQLTTLRNVLEVKQEVLDRKREQVAALESDIRLRDEIIANQRELIEQANSGYVAYQDIHLEDQAKNEALVKHANDLEETLKGVLLGLFAELGVKIPASAL